MKIKELIKQTPEMSEEKLLEIINKNLSIMKPESKNRIMKLHRGETNLAKAFLKEYDIIQDKKSNLTRGQRNIVIGFVGTCMIEMTKGKEINE